MDINRCVGCNIAILGIVHHFDDIKLSNINTINAWCTHFPVFLYILTNDQPEYKHKARNYFSACEKVVLIQENPEEQLQITGNTKVTKEKRQFNTNGGKGNVKIRTREQRVKRIAYLRDRLRSNYNNDQSKEDRKTDAVVVVDLDLLELPSWVDLSEAAFRASKNNMIICANGVEKFMGHFFYIAYDTYAMGIIPWPWTQRRLYKDAMAVAPNLYHETNSCFGGLAVYNPNVYSLKSCNYSSIERSQKCEHQIFHECVLDAVPQIEIGILGTMITYREFDGSLTTFLIIFAFSFLLLYKVSRRIFFKRKKGLKSNE